jgi:BASS family bile acid:Na+ symporter
VFQISILCTVFGFGLKTTVEGLLYPWRRPSLLVRSLLAVFVIMPVVAIVLTRVFDFRRTVEIALIALAISPVPPLLPKREAKAGGRQAYGLGLMALLALLSIVIVPLAVHLLAQYFDRPLAMAPGAIARIVLVMTFLPLVAGMAVRALSPGTADRIVRPVEVLAVVLLTLAALALLAGTWRAVWEAVGDGTVVGIVAFAAAGLLVGHLLGGPDRAEAVVLAVSSATRHPVIALTVAASNFPDERFGGTILLYVIVSAVVAIPYVAWNRKQMSATLATA